MIIKFASQKHATGAIIQMKQTKAYDLIIHKQNYIYNIYIYNYIYVYIYMQMQLISVKAMEKIRICCTEPRKFLPAVHL